MDQKKLEKCIKAVGDIADDSNEVMFVALKLVTAYMEYNNTAGITIPMGEHDMHVSIITKGKSISKH